MLLSEPVVVREATRGRLTEYWPATDGSGLLLAAEEGLVTNVVYSGRDVALAGPGRRVASSES